MAVAAATPVPVLLMLNSVGTTVCTVVLNVCVVEPLLVLTVATPALVPSGTTKLICEGDAYTNPAGRATPAESVIVTVEPPSVDGRGSICALAVTVDRFEPKRVANEAGATTLVVAADDVMGLGVITP
jgi:hypothetical protein